MMFRFSLLPEKNKTKAPHKPWFAALVVINVVILVIVFVLNGLSASGPSSEFVMHS